MNTIVKIIIAAVGLPWAAVAVINNYNHSETGKSDPSGWTPAVSAARATTSRPVDPTFGAIIEKSFWRHDPYEYRFKYYVKVTNPNSSVSVQDLRLECTDYGGSGTAIRSYMRTVYEIIKPTETRELHVPDIWPSTEVRTGCGIISVTAQPSHTPTSIKIVCKDPKDHGTCVAEGDRRQPAPVPKGFKTVCKDPYKLEGCRWVADVKKNTGER